MVEAGDPGPVQEYWPDEGTFRITFPNDHGLSGAPGGAARFDPCVGGNAPGSEVVAWTSSRVYFSVDYDGLRSVHSVRRDPARSPRAAAPRRLHGKEVEELGTGL